MAKTPAARLANSGSIPARAKRIFLYPKTFTPALRPTQPPVEWISGAFSPGYSELDVKVSNSSTSSAEVKNEWSYKSIPRSELMTYRETSLYLPYCCLNGLRITWYIDRIACIIPSLYCCLVLQHAYSAPPAFSLTSCKTVGFVTNFCAVFFVVFPFITDKPVPCAGRNPITLNFEIN